MAHPYLALRPIRNDLVSHYVVAGSKNPLDLSMGSVKRVTDVEACDNTLFNCVQIIANLAILLHPFLPFSSEKVCKWLKISNVWEKQYVLTGYQLPEIEILFERIDKKIIEEEKAKLVKQEEV